MEFQTTRQDVAVNEILFQDNVEQPVDTDITLPDYCPDVSRILKCRLSPRISQKTISAGLFTLEGTAYVHLLYADEEGEIRSFETPVSFSKTLQMNNSGEGGIGEVTPKAEYVNCRAITQRRVEVHGALTLGVKVSAAEKKEIVTDADGAGTQLLRDMVPATSAVANAEKYIILSEDFDLEDNQEAVRNLIRTDVRAVCTETKIIANKVIIKGEVLVTALYCGNDSGTIQCFETTLPLSQIVDVAGVDDGCNATVSLDVAACEIRPRTNMNGETRTLSMTAKICIGVRAYCDADIPVLYDAYSTQYEMDVNREELPVEKIIGSVNESYLCKKTLDLPADSISRIVDLWCDSTVTSTKAENNQLCIGGTVLICVLARDSGGAPLYLERPVEYEYRHDMGQTPRFFRCDPKIVAVAADHTLQPENKLEVRVELSVTAEVFEQNRVSAITSIQLLEDKPKKDDDRSALVIYYADAGENIWEIARHYNTSVDEISNLNKLDGRVLPANAMLLIPSV